MSDHAMFDHTSAAFSRRDLYDVKLVVLFLDAIYLAVRPSGPKEGVICAWGINEDGERVLVSVRLGMRESRDDWLELGRDLTRRGMPAPRLIVADGAPGLISAADELWPRAERQHCVVHRLRNLLAKLPKAEQQRVRHAYWQALNEATSVKVSVCRNASLSASASSAQPTRPEHPSHSALRRWRTTRCLRDRQ